MELEYKSRVLAHIHLICSSHVLLHLQVINFFYSSTRGTTDLSLPGLLGCVCQCCWRGHTQDVLLVPVNISYSRTLEEELYAYELLGVPKPRESTSVRRPRQAGLVFTGWGTCLAAATLSTDTVTCSLQDRGRLAEGCAFYTVTYSLQEGGCRMQ